jgi:hypothetical protein
VALIKSTYRYRELNPGSPPCEGGEITTILYLLSMANDKTTENNFFPAGFLLRYLLRVRVTSCLLIIIYINTPVLKYRIKNLIDRSLIAPRSTFSFSSLFSFFRPQTSMESLLQFFLVHCRIPSFEFILSFKL